MQTVTTTSNIPQSIATTVTMIDPKEMRRRDAETSRMDIWLSERIARGSRETFSEQVTVTPVLAKLLLQRNPTEENRRLSRKKVAEIKSDIQSGHWVFNGETIILSREGMLNDGQHRLTAVCEANTNIVSLVAFGLPRSARLTLDQGSARTASDFLAMSDHGKEAVVLAAVARLYWQFRRHGRISGQSGNLGKTPTKAEVLDVALENENAMLRSIEHVSKKGYRLIGSRSLVAFCHFIFDKIDPVAASNFIGRAIDGANLNPKEPIYTLRERFMNDPRLPQMDRFEGIIRAWNAYRGGGQLSKIQLMGRVPAVAGWKSEG